MAQDTFDKNDVVIDAILASNIGFGPETVEINLATPKRLGDKTKTRVAEIFGLKLTTRTLTQLGEWTGVPLQVRRLTITK